MPEKMWQAKPVLVLKGADGFVKEIYLLNPGEWFPGFGGSSRGLVVRKTASLIVRDKGPWGTRDHELNLADPDEWAFIASRIACGSLKVEAPDAAATES